MDMPAVAVPDTREAAAEPRPRHRGRTAGHRVHVDVVLLLDRHHVLQQVAVYGEAPTDLFHDPHAQTTDHIVH